MFNKYLGYVTSSTGCDYPAEDDVKIGVVYAFGANTGTYDPLSGQVTTGLTIHDYMTSFSIDTVLYSQGVTCYYIAYGEAERTITCDVEYDKITAMTPLPNGNSDMWTVTVRNNAVNGISRNELNIGKDTIKVPAKKGGSFVTRRITKVITETHGYLVLEIR